jgi:hypothetical protein
LEDTTIIGNDGGALFEEAAIIGQRWRQDRSGSQLGFGLWALGCCGLFSVVGPAAIGWSTDEGDSLRPSAVFQLYLRGSRTANQRSTTNHQRTTQLTHVFRSIVTALHYHAFSSQHTNTTSVTPSPNTAATGRHARTHDAHVRGSTDDTIPAYSTQIIHHLFLFFSGVQRAVTI